jgi:O-antigen biosynthesis protein
MSHRVENIWSWLGRWRGNRLTGGGWRALLRWVRPAGDCLTGGGLRSWSRRTMPKTLRMALSQTRWRLFGRRALQSSPISSAGVDRMAADPGAPPESSNLPQHSDQFPVVNSLYETAFGRPADSEGFATWAPQLQAGASLEHLAAQLVGSAEFRARHGSSPIVDIKYIKALYRDGLGREPNLENLAFWLAERKKGITRATALAAVAGSAEALEKDQFLDSRAAYTRWVSAYDTISEADRVAIRTHLGGLAYRPLISLIIASETSETSLHESLDSVISQLYADWELLISADIIAKAGLGSVLGDFITQDSRVKVIWAEDGEGTVALANAAIRLATGEFVAFLRAGDILPEHAFYEVAFELGRHERTDILYTDHDQMNPDRQRSSPWFKPGWDPDLLLAQDYISDLTVYRRKLIEEVGFLRPEFAGAEFHDLALRATGAAMPYSIRHVPAILYHRRLQNESTQSATALPGMRAITASRRAVRDHLDSRGDARAVLGPAPQLPSAIRVLWPVPEHPPLVSVIVPTRDKADLLERCVNGVLHRTDYQNLELLVADNGSSEPSTRLLFERLSREEPKVRVLCYPGPFNYSALNNAAAREAKGEILVLLNNDTDVIGSGWLRELVSQALRPDVGIVGAKLLYANEQIQHAGVVLGPEGHAAHLCRLASRNDPGYFGQLALPRTLSAVTGACIAIRRAVFFELGGFDEIHLQVAFSDIDLCLRLGDYGYRIVWTPFAELFHLESASRGSDFGNPAKQERADREWRHLRETWGSLLETADPFHNPNLLFHWNHCEIPASPRRLKPWRFVLEHVLDLNRYFPLQNGDLHNDRACP